MSRSFTARIQRALAGAPRPAHPGAPPVRGTASTEDLAIRFAEALSRVSGRVERLPGEGAVEEFLRREFKGRAIVRSWEDPDETALRQAEVGVDRADLLLAETGTVVRSYRTREESRISLVPAVSVFLATPDQLVPDLPAALDRIAPAHRAGRAYTVLITGPSRTADIEKELVIPAHGPRELLVLLT